MKPASRQKSRKTRSSSGSKNPIIQKKDAPFFHAKEGSEHSFFQPQARNHPSLPADVQAKMENTMGEDFSGVQIHESSSEAKNMQALAFTQGENVHFAPGQYNPQTRSGQELIGHEFAHVKQQRQGRVQAPVQAKGGLINGDSSLEAEADSMGRKAASASAEPGSASLGLRRSMNAGKTASGNVLQMKPNSDYGEFKPTKYLDVSTYGVDIDLEFHPNTKVDATKIGMTQIVKSTVNGTPQPLSPTRANRQAADGNRVDRLDDKNNPVYGAASLAGNDGLNKTPAAFGNYRLGHHKKDGTGKWVSKEAFLHDKPTLPGRGNNSSQKFETAALALDGVQKDMYYGSVNWGWEVDGKGNFKRLPVTLASSGDMPTATFRAAAKKWNSATALGTIKTTGDPTAVYSTSYVKTNDILKKGTTVKLFKSYTNNGVTYNSITAGAIKGLVKTSDLADLGNGAATKDLPVPWKGIVNTKHLAALRQGKTSESATLADLPNGIKVTVINDKSGWLKVHLDPAQKGIITNALGKKAIDAANLLRGYISKELVKKV